MLKDRRTKADKKFLERSQIYPFRQVGGRALMSVPVRREVLVGC